jgi:hypothetical protein
LEVPVAVGMSVDQDTSAAVGPDALAERLAGLRERQFVEVWLSDGSGASICLLKSGPRVLLMFFAKPGEVGLTSRSADTPVVPANLEFHLSNGQVDEHPASWTVPFDDGCRALEYFWFAKAPAPFIRWAE